MRLTLVAYTRIRINGGFMVLQCGNKPCFVCIIEYICTIYIYIYTHIDTYIYIQTYIYKQQYDVCVSDNEVQLQFMVYGIVLRENADKIAENWGAQVQTKLCIEVQPSMLLQLQQHGAGDVEANLYVVDMIPMQPWPLHFFSVTHLRM